MNVVKLFTASLVTETNSFSPFPTGWDAFEACGLCWGEPDYAQRNMFTENALFIRDLAERDGHTVELGMSAYADPAGPTRGPVYRVLRAELVETIAAAGPLDGVLLTLHGAMIAEGCDDCEGDLLNAIRRAVGPHVFVGAMLDPHCHLSDAMVQAADAITIMKEYPHTDGKKRLEDLYRIFLATRRQGVRPACALVDCYMTGVWPTTEPGVRSLVDRISAREADPSILAIGFAHGFPWGDVADAGARVLVISDNDIELAEQTAVAVANDIQRERGLALQSAVAVDEALESISAPGLTVIADFADNPGGGAPGDATFVLRAVLEAGLRGIGFAIFHDPAAVQACCAAGEGSRLDLELGGKLGTTSGEPVSLLGAQVRALREDHAQLEPGGAMVPLGASAWIEADGVHVVLSESRAQAMSPSVFGNLGLDIQRLDAVVLKSTHHFRASFEAVAARMLWVETPGSLSSDFCKIPYRKKSLAYWPRRALREPSFITRKAPTRDPL